MPPQQLERLLNVGGDGFDLVTHGELPDSIALGPSPAY
jgi:hypothetical protein